MTVTDALGQALAESERLRDFIERLEAEIGRLPAFVRPLMRTGFRARVGLTLEDWQVTLNEAADRLRRSQAGDRHALAALRAEYPRLRLSLDQFASYCREAPTLMARLTRDERFLNAVRSQAAERVAAIEAFCAALDHLNEQA